MTSTTMTSTPRTSITYDGHRVTVRAWDDETRRVQETRYMAPLGGGYVRIDDGRNYPQVCEGLVGSGQSLTLLAGGDLLALIRREYRRGRRAAAAYAAYGTR